MGTIGNRDMNPIRSLLRYDREIFRDIDVAFARLVTRLTPEENESVALAALLVSRAAGEGHVCIDLHQWADREIGFPGGGPTGVVCPSYAEWIDRLKKSPAVGGPGAQCPLVYDEGGRVYLQRLYRHEQTLAHWLMKKARGLAALPTKGEWARIQSVLDSLFGKPSSANAPDWQRLAVLVALLKRLCIISGAPGTGKTTTVVKILAMFLDRKPDVRMRIHLCAPTGKAAARLNGSLHEAFQSTPFQAPVAARLSTLETVTVHRLLQIRPDGKVAYDETNPLPTDLVVVDEASMVDLVLMSRLVRAIPEEGRLVILGDKDQLASVEAGSVFGDLCRRPRDDPKEALPLPEWLASETHPDEHNLATDRFAKTDLSDCTVVLQENYRFDAETGIGALTQSINRGDTEGVKKELTKSNDGMVYWQQWRHRSDFHKLLAAHALKGYETYLTSKAPAEALAHYNRFMILTPLTSGPFGVAQINLLVSDRLGKARLIGPDRLWYRGRPVMVTRNNYRIGLYNGDTGLVWPDAEGRLKVWFQGENGGIKAISPHRLPEHRTAFAMTVHKSQGSEFESTLLVLPDQDSPVLSRELLYTGCSRARRRLILLAPEGIIDQALTRTIQRTSGLIDALGDQRN